MSGPSGSGKTTEAQRILNTLVAEGETVKIVGANDYFTNEDGVYDFNPRHLDEAHADCLYDFVEAITTDEVTVLIVDNTNLAEGEISPYLRVAEAYEYDVEIVVCRGKYPNSHGVEPWRVTKQEAKLGATLKWWNIQDGATTYGAFRGTKVRVVE